MNLKELDISHNPMDIQTSTALVSWISFMARDCHLERLSVANTNVVIGELLDALMITNVVRTMTPKFTNYWQAKF